MRAQEDRLAAISDGAIDLGDMPEIKDMSAWVRVADYPDLAAARRAAHERRARKVAAE